MANRADRLIAGGRAKFLPRTEIATLTPGAINHFPVIEPAALQCTELDRKHMNLAAGQPGCVSLLKLRSDRVVDGVCVQFAVGLPDVEIVPTVAEYHAGKEGSPWALGKFHLSFAIGGFIFQVKLVVVLKIANDILRSIRAKHF